MPKYSIASTGFFVFKAKELLEDAKRKVEEMIEKGGEQYERAN